MYPDKIRRCDYDTIFKDTMRFLKERCILSATRSLSKSYFVFTISELMYKLMDRILKDTNVGNSIDYILLTNGDCFWSVFNKAAALCEHNYSGILMCREECSTLNSNFIGSILLLEYAHDVLSKHFIINREIYEREIAYAQGVHPNGFYLLPKSVKNRLFGKIGKELRDGYGQLLQ